MSQSRRRPKGEGSLVPRRDESGKVIGYLGRLDLGWKDGKRQRRKFIGKTQREVLDRMREAQHQAKTGTLPPPGRHALTAWLEHWLEVVAKPRVRPSTYRTYAMYCRQHIIPAVGSVELKNLTVAHVRGLLHNPGNLSPRSISHMRAILRAALNVAIKDGLIPSGKNVAAYADPPKVAGKPMQAFTPEQAQAFLASITGDPLEPVYVLALGVGMRQGEILGLTWKHVDLEAGTLHVEQALQRIEGTYELVPPKSTRSRRKIDLPAFVVAALRAHSERQLLDPVVSMDWPDLVFRTADGQPRSGNVITHDFQTACARADLPRLRFHDLRHSCASLHAALGSTPLEVMELLGHSSITMTLGTYSHVFDKAKREAAARMDGLLGSRVG